MKNKSMIVLCLALQMMACKESKTLPILGEKQELDGKTIYHTIPDFEFLNQDSVLVSQQIIENKIYVADFFFTSCPTICPVMKTQMLRLHEKFKNNSDILLLSHSIDPTLDTPSVLKAYATKLNANTKQWHFLTGDRKKLFEIGEKSYMVTTQEDSTQAGGLLHSGAFLLIDKKRRVRGMYDGTKAPEVDKLIKDIQILIDEK